MSEYWSTYDGVRTEYLGWGENEAQGVVENGVPWMNVRTEYLGWGKHGVPGWGEHGVPRMR